MSSTNLKEIAVLITCHNRREKTLTCLASLFKCSIPSGYSFDVFLVDDGSSDRTDVAVHQNFPEVNVIRGDGNLYWNGGMRLAWKTAAETKFCDFYLWLNDDVILYESAILDLINTYTIVDKKSIIVGTLEGKGNSLTYGGKINGELVHPENRLQEVSLFNGNLVLIPNTVYQTVGNLSEEFTHGIADFDYSLRAKAAGIKLYVGATISGRCETNDINIMYDCNYSFLDRLRALYNPKGAPPNEMFVYNSRHKNLLYAIALYISSHLHCLFPILWKKLFK